MLVSSPSYSILLFRQSLTEPIDLSVSLASQQASGILSLPPTAALGLQVCPAMPDFYMGARDLNPGTFID